MVEKVIFTTAQSYNNSPLDELLANTPIEKIHNKGKNGQEIYVFFGSWSDWLCYCSPQ